MLHIEIALNYFTLVCNLKTVPMEVVDLAMVNFDNFRKYDLVTV